MDFQTEKLTGIEKEEGESLLQTAKEAQVAFWDALRNLERWYDITTLEWEDERGPMEINSNQDLDGLSLEEVWELSAPE